MFVRRKKIWFILHFRTLGTFIVGGSPMLKTVKNGNGIRVDPSPCFLKIPTFSRYFFLGGSVPEAAFFYFILIEMSDFELCFA